jgi:hypothetical protein
VEVDVLDRLVERVDDPTARVSERYSVSQSSSVASVSAPPTSARVRPSTRSSTPGGAQRLGGRGQERRGGVDVDEQRLGGVADAGPLGLGVEDDPLAASTSADAST